MIHSFNESILMVQTLEWTDSGVRYRLRIPVEHAVVISD